MKRRTLISYLAAGRAGLAPISGLGTGLGIGIGSGIGLTTGTARAAAGDGPVPPPQRQPLVLRNAHLHPVSGPPLPGGSLLAENGRIVAVAPAGQALPSPSAPPLVVDLAGRHVYPGFLAANGTMGISEVTAVAATVDTTELGPLNPNARAVLALNADSELLPVARSGGVLAALSVPQGPAGGGIAGTSALLQTEGWDWEELALVSDLGLHVFPPNLRLSAAALGPQVAGMADEMRRFSQERLRLIDDAFGHAAAYAQARAADPRLPSDRRWDAMRPALIPGASQRPVFVHANDVAQIRWALGLAERHGLRLVLVGGADALRVADQLKARRIPVVVTAVHRLPLRRDEDVDGPFRLPARLHEAGVAFCIARGTPGSGASSTNERNLPFEAATAAAHGLPRDEALKAITLYPARILGVEDRLGSLQPGRLASFLVTDGDPLETPTRIERLFVQGREVSTANRQSRLADRYRPRIQP